MLVGCWTCHDGRPSSGPPSGPESTRRLLTPDKGRVSTISHFTEIELAITDKDALLAALAEMGYEGKVEVHDVPITLYGYDDRPRNLHGREVQAEIVIRRTHLWRAANDIGFARRPGGTYLAYISEYDRQVQPDWYTRLLQVHGLHVARRKLQALGCTDYQITRQQDGTVVLCACRYVS